MKKSILALAITGALTFTATSQAAVVDYGWEDGVGTVLGQYDAGQAPMEYSNITANPHTGSHSLLIKDVDASTTGTQQGYIAWVTGLTDGDTVDASFWGYDTTASASPSLRIWGHYTLGTTDVNSYEGSAGGNNTYTDGLGWSQVSNSWVFDSAGGTRDGIMIEVRFYDGGVGAQTALVDDLHVESSAGTIMTPSAVPVPAAVWLFGSGLLGLVGFARRK